MNEELAAPVCTSCDRPFLPAGDPRLPASDLCLLCCLLAPIRPGDLLALARPSLPRDLFAGAA